MPELSEGTINAKKKSPAELAISTEDDGTHFILKKKQSLRVALYYLYFFFRVLDFDPVRMATNLFGTVKTSLANIPFPWNK